jgi:drug/metabolite transporter (DMT)-like permease
MNAPHLRRPAAWALGLGFAIIYLSWGTTYLAIRKGVEVFPPALFGGLRIGLAGLLLLAFLWLRGVPLAVPRRDLPWLAAVGGLLFVGGNGLISLGQKTVPSGAASVLVATTPLWIALVDWLWPHGERLTTQGWLGLLIGPVGVLVLLAPRLSDPAALLEEVGPLFILGSALAWAVGSVLSRHRRPGGSHLATAAWQMVLGGGGLTLIGLAAGEAARLTPGHFTPTVVFAFFYLLVVGSLLGFVTFNWLLGHVSAALVGTYAYVNPVVAILVGWLLGGEALSGWTIGGMLVILAGVALVRGGVRPEEAAAAPPRDAQTADLPAASSETLARDYILSSE